VLALLLLVDLPRLRGEWRFFQPGILYDAVGGAPVPQDDALTPGVDAALRRAALLLPVDSVCVIAHSSWNRDYFRASYLLLPRRVWPADALLDGSRLTPEILRAALQAHHAGCLLVPTGVAAPTGMRRLTTGGIALYTFSDSRSGTPP
jgi:hypothetical protein